MGIETKTCTLGDIGKVCMCKRVLKSQTSSSGDIPFYKIATFGGKADTFISRDLYNEYKTKYNFPKKGDILISAAGTVGKTVIYDGKDAFFQDSNIVWIDNDETQVINDYLYYFYQTHPWKVTSGSTILRLYNDNISGATIAFPKSIKEQKNIVQILKAIDTKITNNNAISSQLESLAKTIYDYWFLQFDFPDENGRPYKSSGGKMVWNEELKRVIPEWWKVGTFSALIKETKNGDWGQEDKQSNFTHYVRCLRGADFPAISGHDTLKAPYRYILEKNTNKLLSSGDIIVEISGGSPTQSTGRSCLVTAKTLERFNSDVITSNFCQAITLQDLAFSEWFYETWKSYYSNGVFFNYEGKTTGIKNLLFDAVITQIPVIIPSRIVANNYHKVIGKMFETIQANNIENDALSSLRDFLLPMLMNGQVTFKEDA